ncbi:RNA-binding protein Nova-1-like protein passilla [Dermatophagoides pteronyssinus]|uniref:RNA-binding protein Nova-1-like protein passilla n=1 Tax=Dermatophagoides pteronyssinus TaxID=6956 RepID=UPI003F67A018
MMMALDASRPTNYRNNDNYIEQQQSIVGGGDPSSNGREMITGNNNNGQSSVVTNTAAAAANAAVSLLSQSSSSTTTTTTTNNNPVTNNYHPHQQQGPSSTSPLQQHQQQQSQSSADNFPDENDVQLFWYPPDQMSYSPSSPSQGGNNAQLYYLKILVPAVAAGAIIGKGGETIGQLQKETNTRVKMSKSNDFYPGSTNERVCLISGPVEGIIRINEFIMEKIKEKPDPNAKMAIDFDNKQPAEREKQVKILVPNSTAGMIIGKAGSYIKHIKEESGAYVQISQKSLDHALAERCITVIGEFESNKKACQMILAKIVEDPQSGSCLNVSYADVTGPVANFNPTGSPYANVSNSSIDNSNHSNPNYSSNNSLNSMSPTLNNSFNGNQNANSPGNMVQFGNVFQNSPSGSQTQMIENFRSMLRACGYSEDAVNEICTAMATLANYGMLGLGLGLNGMINGTPILGGLGMGLTPGTPTNNCGIQMNQNTMFSQGGTIPGLDQSCSNVPQPSGNGGNNLFGPVGSVGNSLSAMGITHGSFTHNSSPVTGGGGGRQDRHLHMPDGSVFETFRASPSLSSPGNNNNNNNNSSTTIHPSMTINSNSFGIGALHHSPNSMRKSSPPTTPTDQSPDQSLNHHHHQQQQNKLELEVSDNIIGAILGHGGKLLVELQRSSGANIQISKKGIFAPGTRNRIVTISGSPNAVQSARVLIEHQINEEESKRSNQQQQQQQQQQPINNFLR